MVSCGEWSEDIICKDMKYSNRNVPHLVRCVFVNVIEFTGNILRLAKRELCRVQFTALAARPGVCNLGQGFPDYEPPSSVTKELVPLATNVSVENGNARFHQYTRGFVSLMNVHQRGDTFLALGSCTVDRATAEALCRSRFACEGRDERDSSHRYVFEESTRALIVYFTLAVGAYQALFYACMAYLNHGDEAIVIEPAYDCYVHQIKIAGATPVSVALRLDEVWSKCLRFSL